jgi:hypothetical protein
MFQTRFLSLILIKYQYSSVLIQTFRKLLDQQGFEGG